MPTFQPNVPTGSVPFNEDYLNLQGNNQQLNIAYGVDHVPYTDTSGVPPAGITGMHTLVHLVPFSTTASNPPNNQPVVAPSVTAGYGQIFSAQINDGLGIDSVLYWLSGTGKLVQFTRNIGLVNGANGVTFLPGGVIMQWGSVNAPGGAGTVTFPQQFTPATVPFSIQLTARNDGSHSAFTYYINGAPTNTGFVYGGSTTGSQTLYWVALGT